MTEVIPEDVMKMAEEIWNGPECFNLSEIETVARAIMAERLAQQERDAKICEEPINHQHPLKPPGVIMSVTPPSPAHAAAIRRPS